MYGSFVGDNYKKAEAKRWIDLTKTIDYCILLTSNIHTSELELIRMIRKELLICYLKRR